MSQGVAPVVRARRQVGSRARRARLRTGSLGAAGAGVTAFLVLAGCTAAPPPQEIQSDYTQPPASPSPSASPISPTAPVRPPEMDRTDEVGAVAAANYFIQLYDYARATGDTDEWSVLGSSTCAFCTNVTAALDSIYGQKQRLSGGRTTVTDARLVDTDAELVTYLVEVTYSTAPAELLDETGSTVAEYPAESAWVVLEVGPAGGGWQLIDGQHLDEPLP